MRLKSYKESNYRRLGIIKDSKGNRISNIGSRGQTKNFSKKRRLSGLCSNSNSLKMVYI